jgi:hypothetical protein
LAAASYLMGLALVRNELLTHHMLSAGSDWVDLLKTLKLVYLNVPEYNEFNGCGKGL